MGPICSGFPHLVCSKSTTFCHGDVERENDTSWNEEAAGAHPPAPSWLQTHSTALLACTCPAQLLLALQNQLSFWERQLHPASPASRARGLPAAPMHSPFLITSDISAPSHCQQQDQAQGHKISTEQLTELLLFKIRNVNRTAPSTELHSRVAVGKGSSHHLNYGQTTSTAVPASNEDVKTRLLCELKHSCQERLAKRLGTTLLHANSPSAPIWKETVLIHAGIMWFMCRPGWTSTAYSDAPTWVQLFRWCPTF